jgi:hypothetical protein
MSSEFLESFFGSFTAAGGVILEFGSECSGKLRSGNEDGSGIFPIRENYNGICCFTTQSNNEEGRVVETMRSCAGDFELVHGGERMNQNKQPVNLFSATNLRDTSFGAILFG